MNNSFWSFLWAIVSDVAIDLAENVLGYIFWVIKNIGEILMTLLFSAALLFLLYSPMGTGVRGIGMLVLCIVALVYFMLPSLFVFMLLTLHHILCGKRSRRMWLIRHTRKHCCGSLRLLLPTGIVASWVIGCCISYILLAASAINACFLYHTNGAILAFALFAFVVGAVIVMFASTWFAITSKELYRLGRIFNWSCRRHPRKTS